MSEKRNDKIRAAHAAGRKLTEIAREHGISKQRVHQIVFPKSKPGPRVHSRGRPVNWVARVDRLVARKEDVGKRHRTVATGTGRLGQELFAAYAAANGLKAEDVSETEPFDFLVNGKRVEVKTADADRAELGKWSFSLVNNIGHFDVLALVGIHRGVTYFMLVPASDVDGYHGITTRPFSGSRGWSRWASYMNNVSILK